MYSDFRKGSAILILDRVAKSDCHNMQLNLSELSFWF